MVNANLRRLIARATTALIIALALLAGSAAPAKAEGVFTSYVKQVQPGFMSRVWRDKGADGGNTVVQLTNCKVNKGGATPGSTPLKEVTITLMGKVGNSWRPLKTLSKPCGVYNFGNPGKGEFKFNVVTINNDWGGTRKAFLNASVKVYY